ncbi:MAG: MFS transporter [Proteobacteria bacterium]|nr:MFS transporter [Pseudomonadota bacterium]
MAKPPMDARAVALDLLERVLDKGAQLGEAIDGHPASATLDKRERAFARAIATTTLRRLGQIDALIEHALERPGTLKSRPVRDILRAGTAQLLFIGTPAHAAVDTAVGLAETRGQGAFKALVNALLRRIAREGEAWLAAQDAPRLNTPDWLWRSWEASFGPERARAIAAAHLEEPPLDLTCKSDADLWATRLGAVRLETGSLRLEAAGPVASLAGFAEGAWWVQDAAAALPVRLFGEVRGKRILDLCAAPGGKTAQLAAAGAEVVAVDRSRRRLRQLETNLSRLGLGAETVAADALTFHTEADGILLDVPCTGTGTIRRHPELPWLRTPGDVRRLAERQAALLSAAAATLAPGALLVYSVCSLEAEECATPIEALLEKDASLARVPLEAAELGGRDELITPAGDLRTLPCHLADLGGMDGFYAARLRRSR